MKDVKQKNEEVQVLQHLMANTVTSEAGSLNNDTVLLDFPALSTSNTPAVADGPCPVCDQPLSSSGTVQHQKRSNGSGGGGGRSKPLSPLWLRERREERRTRERLSYLECLKEQLKQNGHTRRAWIQHDTEVTTAIIRAVAQIKEEFPDKPQAGNADANRDNSM